MKNLIELREYPLSKILKYLLVDKTTKENIIFATDIYKEEYGIGARSPITLDALLCFNSCTLQPRVQKSKEEQADRTRKKAEVFTPSWLCNVMNNHLDEEWFGRADVFNISKGESWTPTEEKISFPEGKSWMDYIESNRLEITCGEAPYIVSRYDTTTGEIIPLNARIGLLDRKLRVVKENTENEEEWLKWTYRAFQSVYGYEYQGDNLLIARINLINSFVEYMNDRLDRVPTAAELRKMANIICWNFWQMDGLKGIIPFGKPVEEFEQIDLFEAFGLDKPAAIEDEDWECRIYDWKANRSITYNSMKKGE